MVNDKSINVSGSFIGSANTGDGAFVNTNQDVVFTDEQCSINFLQGLLTELSQRYPTASEAQKQTVLQMELQEKLRSDPTLKTRFLSAIKAGSLEMVKVLIDNPFIHVPLETVKGWIEAE
jgi:hypothetical protein